MFDYWDIEEAWVPSWDRAGLERLLRYCARPLFAGERLAWVEPNERLVYHLPKPRPDGPTQLSLTPLEFLDRPSPRGSRRPGSTATATTGCWRPTPRCAQR